MEVEKLLIDMRRDMKFLITITKSRSIHWWDKMEKEEMRAWIGEIERRYEL